MSAVTARLAPPQEPQPSCGRPRKESAPDGVSEDKLLPPTPDLGRANLACSSEPSVLHDITTPITARAELADSPQGVFDFLANVRKHGSLAPSSVRLLARDPDAGVPVHATVRLRGPLAIRRTATAKIVRTRTARMIAGRAKIGRRTRGSVAWTIASRPFASGVLLCMTVEATGLLDGLRGGRRRLERRFGDALACLADQLASAAASPTARTSESLCPRLAPEPAV